MIPDYEQKLEQARAVGGSRLANLVERIWNHGEVGHYPIDEKTARRYRLAGTLAVRQLAEVGLVVLDRSKPLEPPKCGNCRFFVNGFCRRYPPVPVGGDLGMFAAVVPISWCGEWRRGRQ